MNNQIDIEKMAELYPELPPSPRDGLIKKLGIASLVFFLLAAICAWQIGRWWGLGLIVTLYVISTLDEFVHEAHREELVEMYGKLIHEIAVNSEILDDKIPKKRVT